MSVGEILTFKKRFNVKAIKDCVRREKKTLDSINDLETAVNLLTKMPVGGAGSLTPADVQQLQAELARLRTEFQAEQDTAPLHPHKSYQQLDVLKKQAREAAGKATNDAAARLKADLERQKFGTLSEEMCNGLEGLYNDAKKCADGKKPAAEVAEAYRKFFDETQKVLAERDRQKAAWGPIAPQLFKAIEQMQELGVTAKLLKLDSLAAASSAASKACDDAQLMGRKAQYAEAKISGEKALAQVATAQSQFDQYVAKCGTVKNFLEVPMKTAKDYSSQGKKGKLRWLEKEASAVLTACNSAIQTEVSGKQPEAIAAAKASVAALAKLTTKLANYQSYVKSWHDHDPKRKQRKSLARVLVAEAKKRNKKAQKADPSEDFKWLEVGAKLYQTEIKAAERLFKNGESQDAYKRAETSGNAFDSDIVARFNKIQGAELLIEADKLIAADPDGPEAKMKDALGVEEFSDRMALVTNAAAAAGANKHGLSLGEMVAIYTYTALDYKGMNELLLFGKSKYAKPPEAYLARIEQTKAAIAKLPPYTGGNTTRGEEPWKGAEELYQEKATFKIKQFWSTGIGFSFEGLYQFTIVPKTGKKVEAFSKFVHEAEVLFAPGTQFYIKSRSGSVESGPVKLLVEEV